jgi:hypothetical protein
VGDGDLTTSSGAQDLREGSMVAVEAMKKKTPILAFGWKGHTYFGFREGRSIDTESRLCPKQVERSVAFKE